IGEMQLPERAIPPLPDIRVEGQEWDRRGIRRIRGREGRRRRTRIRPQHRRREGVVLVPVVDRAAEVQVLQERLASGERGEVEETNYVLGGVVILGRIPRAIHDRDRVLDLLPDQFPPHRESDHAVEAEILGEQRSVGGGEPPYVDLVPLVSERSLVATEAES